jgi:hypothetical protein
MRDSDEWWQANEWRNQMMRRVCWRNGGTAWTRKILNKSEDFGTFAIK